VYAELFELADLARGAACRNNSDTELRSTTASRDLERRMAGTVNVDQVTQPDSSLGGMVVRWASSSAVLSSDALGWPAWG
jgi:hypothetical protein